MEANGHYRFTFDVTKISRTPPCEPDLGGQGQTVQNMISSTTKGFYKNEDCPSSNELLDFQNGDTPRTRGTEIAGHLTTCEFCEAEVDFYSHYPQEEGIIEITERSEIPAPLFELAEALLKNRHADSSSLDSLLREKGGVVVDKI